MKTPLTLVLAALAAVSLQQPTHAPAQSLGPWQPQTVAGFSNNLNGVTFGNGQFVTVGAQGSILRSPDGVQWTTEISGITRDLNHVCYGGGLFVACGTSDTLLTSPDARTWTPRSVGSVNGSLVEWRGALSAPGKFLVVGTKGATASSPQGQTWSYHDANTAAEGALPDRLRRAAYGQGLFAAVGAGYEPYRGVLVTSPDGESWTPRDGRTGEKWLYHVTFANGQFVAVGEDGVLVTSPDGLQWTPRTSGVAVNLWSVGHGPAGFVAVGDGGRIRTSLNGTTWSASTSGTTKALFDVATGNGIYVIVGRDGTILRASIEGSGVPIQLSTPVKQGHQFRFQFTAEVGRTYQVQSSTNLLDWTTSATLLATNSTMRVTLDSQTQPHNTYRVFTP